MGRLTRSSSPLGQDYESYDNTRETLLRTEYHVQTLPKPSEKKAANPKLERVISRIRLVLRIFSFLIASSIVAILSYSVWLYRSTKDRDVEKVGEFQDVYQTVWVSHLKMQPTYVLLGVSSAAAFLSLIIIIASFSKIVRRVTNVSNLVTAIVSGIGVLLWLGVGIWYKRDDWNKAMNMDITSYVCRHEKYQALQSVLGNMGALCGALRYAWWAVVLASSVELFSMATVGWGILAAKKRGAYSKI